MRACVIGAGGLIGRHLCPALLARGYQTTAVAHRTPRPAGMEAAEWFRCDGGDLAALLRSLAPWDLVIDLRAYKRDDLGGLAEQAGELTAHWIHVSSVYVYRRLSEALNIAPESEFLPVPIPEETPCRPSGEYGTGKLACEQYWVSAHRRCGAPVTITRLPFVYGPHDRSGRARFYIERLLTGDTIRLPDSGERLVDLLFVEDLVNVLTRLAGQRRSLGEVYNLSVRPALPLKKHVESLAEVLGVQAKVADLRPAERPPEAAPFAYPVDLMLDATRLRNLIGEVSAVPLRETWASVVSWECSGAQTSWGREGAHLPRRGAS